MKAIFGSPGCGKTTRLMGIVADRLSRGLSVTVCSYTKSAAQEIADRAKVRSLPGKLRVGTIHSLCFQSSGTRRAQILDNSDLKKIGRMASVDIAGTHIDGTKDVGVGDEYLAILNRAGATGSSPFEAYMASDRPGNAAQFAHFAGAYSEYKREYGMIDFNDLLWRGVGCLEELRSDVLIVDEAQDLSPLQWRVIESFSAEEKIVAGDDDQSLYDWAGADPERMLQISECEVLEQSYRVPARVHRIANRVASKISTRKSKEYRPRPEDGEFRQVSLNEAMRGVKHGDDVLVLYRAHRFADKFEEVLRNKNIPYSGAESPLDSSWARSARRWEALRESAAKSGGKFVVDERSEAVFARTMTSGALARVLRGDGSVRSKPWWEMIAAPAQILRYLVAVDKKHGLSVAPTIRLSTIHGAKGKEADHVVLLNSLDSQRVMNTYMRNPDSEARVFYVGVTRAKKKLDIVVGPNPFVY